MDELTPQYPPLPADDLKRNLTLAQIDQDKACLTLFGRRHLHNHRHGAETAGRFV